MSNPYLTPNELFSLWNEFIISGRLRHTDMQMEIAKSWERSRQAGVHPYNCIDLPQHTQENYDPPAHISPDLMAAASPVMDEVYESLKGVGFRVIMADAQGYTIKIISDSDNNTPFSWSEKAIGTNAIGTAIQIKKPVQISGIEHYCYHMHDLTSSATPIIDDKGNLLMVLALTGPLSEDHTRVLSMLLKAAEKIVNRLTILTTNRQLKTYVERLTNIINTISDGVIIFTTDGLIEHINPAMEKILDQKESQLVGTPLQNLFDSKGYLTKKMLSDGTPYNDMEVSMDTPQGKVDFLASARPNLDGKGNIIGGMIVLQSLDRIQNLVSRYYGGQAQYTFQDIIGKSKAIRDTITIARLASLNQSHVLLQGESGTGKEIFAQSIHNASRRHRGPFLAINCGAIPKELIGSELFGYVEGAFTGAKRGGSPGKFEMASGGTIFLDEIGDMPLELQVALLRVLQNKRVTRIGDAREIPVDVRVICATNKNLYEEIEKGNFREDLYYRLNVISIKIPPLRERREDIPLLVNYCLDELDQDNAYINSIRKPEIMDYLKQYHWPGNVRELQNVIERLVCIAAQHSISVNDLPPEIFSPTDDKTSPSPTSPPGELSSEPKRKNLFAETECEQIKNLLLKYNGNKSQVAKKIGFSRTTLYRKIKLYNIE